MTHPQDKGNEGLIREMQDCIDRERLYYSQIALPGREVLPENWLLLLERALTVLKAESSPHVVAEQVANPNWCPDCNGSGEVLGEMRPTPDPQDAYTTEVPCPRCNGTGESSAPQQTATPEGWQIVPKVASSKMLDAGVAMALQVTVQGQGGWSRYISDLYAQLLAAAPSPAAVSSVPSDRVRDLLHRALEQLDQWQKKYGTFDPEWLPPGGDVRFAEDVAAYLAGD